MGNIKNITAEWALRLSLGIMYAYSGFDILRHPKAWRWAIQQLPAIIKTPIASSIGVDKFLFIQGWVEIAFAIILLFWLMPKILVKLVAILSTIEMVAIVFLVGVTDVTFRDIGLIGSGLALFLTLRNRS
jgi:hypothetical protein